MLRGQGGDPAAKADKVRGKPMVNVTGSWKSKKGGKIAASPSFVLRPLAKDRDKTPKTACVAGLGAGAMLDDIISRHLNAA
jgi:hypothetical protein